MNSDALRQELWQQLQSAPDEVLMEIADFAAFVLSRRRGRVRYDDWTDEEWQEFALSQFLRDADEAVEYTLEDAEPIDAAQSVAPSAGLVEPARISLRDVLLQLPPSDEIDLKAWEAEWALVEQELRRIENEDYLSDLRIALWPHFS